MSTDTISPKEIAAIRNALGWTQAKFAAALGVNHTAVSHWENGLRAPSGSAEILLQMLQKRAEKRLVKK